jgi:hypothetical protein
MVPNILERPPASAAGGREQAANEVRRQRGRTNLHRRVPVQVVGIRMRVVVVMLQPGEQVAQVRCLVLVPP